MVSGPVHWIRVGLARPRPNGRFRFAFGAIDVAAVNPCDEHLQPNEAGDSEKPESDQPMREVQTRDCRNEKECADARKRAGRFLPTGVTSNLPVRLVAMLAGFAFHSARDAQRKVFTTPP